MKLEAHNGTDILESVENTHRAIAKQSLAENTRITYAKAWGYFSGWCANRSTRPLEATPEVVADFLVEAATRPSVTTGEPLSMGTVQILNCAIAKHFWENEKQSPTGHPTVVGVLRGLSRMNGKPPRQVKALREKHIEQMIKACDKKTLIGLRDAAVLALGFSAAMRRSELCALHIDDMDIISDKAGLCMLLTIRKSKTDQDGKGQVVPVLDGKRIRPVSRVRAWIKAAGLEGGYLFRTMRRGGNLRGERLHHSDVPRLVKKYAAIIGLDPALYAGHSLRAGFVTSAAVHGARLDKIMEVTRHTNPQTVMKYIRDADVFTDHAGKGFL